MLIGNQECTNGTSMQIYTDMLNQLEAINAFTYIDESGNTVNWSSANKTIFCNRLKVTSYATAKSIVEYIQTNADVQVRSNIAIDTQFWTWFNLLIGVLTSSGGVTLSPAMSAFLITNPIPTSLISQSNKVISTQDGVQ